MVWHVPMDGFPEYSISSTPQQTSLPSNGPCLQGVREGGGERYTLLDLLLSWMPCLSSGVVAVRSEIPILFRIDFSSYQVIPYTVHSLY